MAEHDAQVLTNGKVMQRLLPRRRLGATLEHVSHRPVGSVGICKRQEGARGWREMGGKRSSERGEGGGPGSNQRQMAWP